MTYLESSATTDLEKATLFNIVFSFCLQKIFTPTSAPNEIESPNIQLSDLFVTPALVSFLLGNVPPSTIAVEDGIPPFVLHNCAVTLASLVHLVTYYLSASGQRYGSVPSSPQSIRSQKIKLRTIDPFPYNLDYHYYWRKFFLTSLTQNSLL